VRSPAKCADTGKTVSAHFEHQNGWKHAEIAFLRLMVQNRKSAAENALISVQNF
jgi:hypothetical protein